VGWQGAVWGRYFVAFGPPVQSVPLCPVPVSRQSPAEETHCRLCGTCSFVACYGMHTSHTSQLQQCWYLVSQLVVGKPPDKRGGLGSVCCPTVLSVCPSVESILRKLHFCRRPSQSSGSNFAHSTCRQLSRESITIVPRASGKTELHRGGLDCGTSPEEWHALATWHTY
jgi:hypothetical protein